MADPIDWTRFDKYPEDTCFCGCGAVFGSHVKFTNGTMHSRKPCPGCGKTSRHLRKASGEPEFMTIGGKNG